MLQKYDDVFTFISLDLLIKLEYKTISEVTWKY